MTSFVQATASRYCGAISTCTIGIGTVLAVICVILPLPSHGQVSSVRDVPRSLEIFAAAPDYKALSPDRHGTPALPVANELGFLLVLRMFGNVCLALERGETLDTIMPAGFAAYDGSPYYFGPDAAPRGKTTVLSPTGDSEKDAQNGHPAIWLEPGVNGMTCSVEWRIREEMKPQSRQAIAGLLADWVPWELSLVRASRPQILPQPALSDALEWDRPCQGRWCPATAFYNLTRGDLTMRMTLNITDIAGARP